MGQDGGTKQQEPESYKATSGKAGKKLWVYEDLQSIYSVGQQQQLYRTERDCGPCTCGGLYPL